VDIYLINEILREIYSNLSHTKEPAREDRATAGEDVDATVAVRVRSICAGGFVPADTIKEQEPRLFTEPTIGGTSFTSVVPLVPLEAIEKVSSSATV
jgi:hypothetical protein